MIEHILAGLASALHCGRPAADVIDVDDQAKGDITGTAIRPHQDARRNLLYG
jgi:hypothetical protein